MSFVVIRLVQVTISLRGSYLFQSPYDVTKADFSHSTALYGGVRVVNLSLCRKIDPAGRHLTSLKVGVMPQKLRFH
jgi:hypothetical protein